MDVQTIVFLLLCLLNALAALFKDKQLHVNAVQTAVLRHDGYEWQGAWEDTSRHLEQWAPPVLWEFTPE